MDALSRVSHETYVQSNGTARGSGNESFVTRHDPSRITEQISRNRAAPRTTTASIVVSQYIVTLNKKVSALPFLSFAPITYVTIRHNVTSERFLPMRFNAFELKSVLENDPLRVQSLFLKFCLRNKIDDRLSG